MRWPWSELGIAPTQDVVEIKRAYAKRLKTARPDDDAAAYQNLREAYEAALEQARLQVRHSGVTPPFTPLPEPAPEPAPPAAAPPLVAAAARVSASACENAQEDGNSWPAADDGFSTSAHALAASQPGQAAPSAAPPAGAAEAPPWPRADDGFSAAPEALPSVPPPTGLPEAGLEADVALPDYVSPETIACSIHPFWEAYGDEALVALWPRVRDDLDALPLQLRAEASGWMATLVLDFPDLPADFVKPLARYFGWREDFRIARILGAERAQALYEHLHALGLRAAPHEAERQALRHVQAVAHWLRQGREWRARLLSVLMPDAAFRRWKHASEAQLEAIDIAAHEIPAINAVMRWHHVARSAGLFGVCMLLALLFERDLPVAGAHTVFAFGAVLLALLGGWFYASVLEHIQALVPQRIKAWHVRAPLTSAMLLLGLPAALAAALAFMPDTGEVWAPLRFFGGWGLALLLPALVWPDGQRWQILLLPVSLALTLALLPLLSRWSWSPLQVFILAQVWTLGANVLLHHRTAGVMRLYRRPLVWLYPKRLWGWILYLLFFKGVAIMVAAGSLISVPLSLFVSTLRHGAWAGVATLGCAFVIAFGIGFGRGNDIGLLLGLVLAVWLMAVLRWIAGRLADRLGGSE